MKRSTKKRSHVLKFGSLILTTCWWHWEKGTSHTNQPGHDRQWPWWAPFWLLYIPFIQRAGDASPAVGHSPGLADMHRLWVYFRPNHAFYFDLVILREGDL